MNASCIIKLKILCVCPLNEYLILANQYAKYNSVTAQAAQAHYVWVRASEVIWSEHTRIISVLSEAK